MSPLVVGIAAVDRMVRVRRRGVRMGDRKTIQYWKKRHHPSHSNVRKYIFHVQNRLPMEYLMFRCRSHGGTRVGDYAWEGGEYAWEREKQDWKKRQHLSEFAFEFEFHLL